MTDMFRDIAEFHKKFGLEYNGPPRHLDFNLGQFRTMFIGEELAEYISPLKSDHDQLSFVIGKLVLKQLGMERQPLEKQLDALVDIVYVAIGTAYLHGFDFNEAWRRVHEANMKKVRALREEDSARKSVFDVVKPEGWKAPDLSDLVRQPFEDFDPDCVPGA